MMKKRFGGVAEHANTQSAPEGGRISSTMVQRRSQKLFELNLGGQLFTVNCVPKYL